MYQPNPFDRDSYWRGAKPSKGSGRNPTLLLTLKPTSDYKTCTAGTTKWPIRKHTGIPGNQPDQLSLPLQRPCEMRSKMRWIEFSKQAWDKHLGSTHKALVAMWPDQPKPSLVGHSIAVVKRFADFALL